jgi:staphylococcal nuclease domain-containing protein 1
VKARQFLPFFKRAGKTSGVVEFVASGSRLRIFVPREMRLITFLLAGITCPKADRTAPVTKETVAGDPFGNEARTLTKELTLQREVEIEVEDIDKAGNFIGWLWVENKNLSVGLVEDGLAAVHFSAEKSQYFRQLKIAEDNAKARKENVSTPHLPSTLVSSLHPAPTPQISQLQFKT